MSGDDDQNGTSTTFALAARLGETQRRLSQAEDELRKAIKDYQVLHIEIEGAVKVALDEGRHVIVEEDRKTSSWVYAVAVFGQFWIFGVLAFGWIASRVEILPETWLKYVGGSTSLLIAGGGLLLASSLSVATDNARQLVRRWF